MIDRRGQQKDPALLKMELLVSYILMGGVALSLFLLVSALLWRWNNTGSPELHYDIAGTNFFGFLGDVTRQARLGAWRPRLLANLGIAILLLTPFLRVFASFLFFWIKERNWKYTVFTGIVLAVLTYSLFLR